MKPRNVLLFVVNLFFIISFLFACAMPKRRNLEISPFNQQISIKVPQEIVVQFEESFLGKPLNETAWDNVSGPFWDVKESNQIGFTQNYKPQFFSVPPVLLPAAAESGMNLIDTRIVVPFGNIFSEMVVSAVEKKVTDLAVCFDKSCLSASSIPDVFKLKIEQFLVWEAPLNHLNFYAKGESSYLRDGITKRDYLFEKHLLNQKLGSILSTSDAFIEKMNILSNQFAEEITADVLKNTF